MAHLKKYTKVACGHLFKHYERAKGENGEYIKFGNEDINLDLSSGNYNLAPEHKISQYEFLTQRCSEVQCLKRKDVNVMCSWVVTLPEKLIADVPEARTSDNLMTYDFFKVAYDFLENRYGKENVISSHVHFDETTPHMHFSFVPVVYDKKKGIEKVSAFELISRKELKVFHSELEKHMTDSFGFDVGILNGATAEGNKTKKELEIATAEKKIEKLNAQIMHLEAEFEKKEKNLTDIHESKKNALEGELEGLRREIGAALNIIKLSPTVTSEISEDSAIFLPADRNTSVASVFMNQEIMAQGLINARSKGGNDYRRVHRIAPTNIEYTENMLDNFLRGNPHIKTINLCFYRNEEGVNWGSWIKSYLAKYHENVKVHELSFKSFAKPNRNKGDER